MLIEQTHADLRFAADIHAIAEASKSIANSLAVLSGIAKHKFGITQPYEVKQNNASEKSSDQSTTETSAIQKGTQEQW